MKSLTKLTRHQILLYDGDFDRLSEIYHRRKATEIIRTLVRNHIAAVEARVKENENV